MSAALLDHIAVLEWGAGTAIAYAGRLLADAGAQVAIVRPDGQEGRWQAVLDDGKARQAAPELAVARIVLLGEGAPPPDDPRVAALDAIVLRATDFAEDNGMVADDLTLQAAGGMVAGIGEPGRPPLKLPFDQSGFQSGLVLAIAAVAALAQQGPARIEVAAADVWAAFYSGLEVANARFGRSRTLRGGHRALGVPWPRTIVACRDGYFALQCATRDHWRRFLALVGRPELETDPLFADRIKTNDRHAAEAEALFADWFMARSKAELLEAFLAARLPGAPVYDLAELEQHPHLASRGALRTVGAVTAVNAPYRIHPGPAGDPKPPARDAVAPLAGIRVLDFGWVWAGAVPGHILADLGAEVIKVESSARLDYMRQGRPIIGTERDPEQNPMFAASNRGKLSFRVDMTKPEGGALLRELVPLCDVVIENFTPGVLDRFGLGWRRLTKLKPGLILCSMSAAGAEGPVSDIRTYATMIAGLCGIDGLVRYPGERVLGSQSSYADPNASLHAAFAILAALERQRRSGEGCWIDLSQWEAGLALVGEGLAEPARAAESAGRLGRPERAPHGFYPAPGDDAWLALSIGDDGGWQALAETLDRPTWMLDPTLAGVKGRLRERQAIDRRLAAETAALPAEALAERLRARGVDAAPVRRPGDLAGAPGLSADLFQEMTHPVLGAVPVYRLPWRLNGAYLPLKARAPLLGEHNGYVLGQLLGLDDRRRAELDAAGVFT